MSDELRIGLLAEDTEGLEALEALFTHLPHRMVCAKLMALDILPLSSGVDVWLVNTVELEGESGEVFDWLFDNDTTHVLLDGSVEKINICSVNSKIYEAFVDQEEGTSLPLPPDRVWVLAASTGGPRAVSDFLSGLGEGILKDAFIYAQHIEAHSINSLITGIKNKTKLTIRHCEPGTHLQAGQLYIVDPIEAFNISTSGRFTVSGESWSDVYQPSINQVIARVARQFGSKAGAVVFTGMGDDGAEACRLLQGLGGTVYAQSFETCTIDSMPRSVVDTIDDVYTGSIEELAQQVEKH